MLSGSPDVSNSFISPYSNSFVSQSGWWCPALWMSPIHLSPLTAIHLSPSLAGGVRLSGCLHFMCLSLSYRDSFVSQCGWWCPALRMSPIHLSPLTAIHLSPSLAGGVRLSGCLHFMCLSLSYRDSFVSQCGWWCPALRMSPIHLSPLTAIHLSPSLAGGVRLSGCLHFMCLSLSYRDSFVSQCGWWCPALWMSPLHVSLLIVSRFICLPVWLVVSGSLDVSKFICPPLWQFICLPVWLVVSGSTDVSKFICPPLWQFICLPVWLVVSGSLDVSTSCVSRYRIAIHLSPSVAGVVRLSGCLQFIYLPLQQFICLPVWLVVSGSLDVSTSCVSPYRIAIHLSPSVAGGVRLSGCLQIHLSPIMAIHLFARLAGGVRLYGCLQIHLSPLMAIHLSPSLAGGVRLSGCLHFMCLSLSYRDSFVSQCGWCCPALRMSPIHLSPLTAIHLSPSLAGGVRLSGCLRFMCLSLSYRDSFVSQCGWWCPALWMSPNSFVPPYGNSFVCPSGWWCPALRMSPNSFVPPYGNSFVSQSGWWCPALWMSPLHVSLVIVSRFICLPVWLVLSGSPDVSNSFISPYSNSFVSQSGWWCPALWMSPLHVSLLIVSRFICLPVWLVVSGSLDVSKFICPPLWQFICLPVWLVVSGSTDVSKFICPPLWQFICLPVWLVVSGSTDVSNSFVPPYGNSFVSQSGWWCPALRMSCPIHTLCKLVGVPAIIGD